VGEPPRILGGLPLRKIRATREAGARKMAHSERAAPTVVVAILGTDALAEDILARLLEREGYTTRILEASYPMRLVDELLEGVDLLLLTPSLSPDVRGAFLKDMSSSPKTAAVPVLSFSDALKLALVDELAVSASWRDLFEELTSHMGASLERAAASTGALLAVDGGERSAQADAP
jgi:hypothetical protein